MTSQEITTVTPDEFEREYRPADHPGEFVYHITGQDDVTQIKERGLEPQDRVENLQEIGTVGFSIILQFFEEIQEPAPLPFDRRESVYVWPDYTERITGMEPSSATMVFRTQEIDAQMIIAEHTIMDDLVLSSPAYLESQGAKDGAEQFTSWFFNHIEEFTEYHESVRTVSESDDIADCIDEYDEPELIVNGEIPAKSLETIILPDSDRRAQHRR